MNLNDYTKRFEKCYQIFSETFLSFFVWKGLQDKDFEKTYSENNYFWSAILRSLENDWLTNLAKIYEESRYSKENEVISVYALVSYQADLDRAVKVRQILEVNADIIKNIQILRHNQLAHNNAEHLLKPETLLEKFPIEYNKVEQLVLLTDEVLSNLHPETGHGYIYKMLSEDAVNDSKNIIKKLQYYSKLHHNHSEKFRCGEVNDWKFPPDL